MHPLRHWIWICWQHYPKKTGGMAPCPEARTGETRSSKRKDLVANSRCKVRHLWTKNRTTGEVWVSNINFSNVANWSMFFFRNDWICSYRAAASYFQCFKDLHDVFNSIESTQCTDWNFSIFDMDFEQSIIFSRTIYRFFTDSSFGPSLVRTWIWMCWFGVCARLSARRTIFKIELYSDSEHAEPFAQSTWFRINHFAGVRALSPPFDLELSHWWGHVSGPGCVQLVEQ